MKINKTLLLLAMASLAGTFFIYNRLPEQIPIHWGIDGNIDRYGERYTALITGALPLLMFFLMYVIPKIDPRKDSYEKHMGAYKTMITMLIVFLCGLHWMVMAFSLGYNINIVFFIKLGLGVVFIVIGNYLPVVKHNYTLGIRVPWTLADEVVWEKTHRIGGYGFVFSGILWFVFAFIDYPWVFFFLLGTLLAMITGTIVYSYVIFNKRRTSH